MYSTDATEVVVTLTTNQEPTPPLDEGEEYFIIGSVSFVRQGACRYYDFSVEHWVKIESREGLHPHEREVSINGRGSIVHVKPYMRAGADWLPTWLVIIEHQQHVSYPLGSLSEQSLMLA